MITFLIGLSVLSFVALFAGAGGLLLSSRQTSWRHGEEVGTEMIAEQMDRDDEGAVAQRAAFRGKAVAVRTETSVGLGDVKKQIKAGQWRAALPGLLVLAGFIGLLFFGSLALFVAMEDKLVGGLIALVGIFAALRIAIAMARA